MTIPSNTQITLTLIRMASTLAILSLLVLIHAKVSTLQPPDEETDSIGINYNPDTIQRTI